ncbi:glutathione S-transferase 2-like [Leguminivora glycinivorella]|uniref:glutathione S-transferase 2-like n=1 Tax=Leguminivora glycinivorella TaxID=1035111 RepID=UPI00200F0EB6|nr:glutathione S-transferase 2-like [Leguminivora glycinivorella]
MSFRHLGKLFKTKKTDKQESKEISLPTEGFHKSIQMLLAYSGQQLTETGLESREVLLDSPSRCGLHSVAVLRCLGRSHGVAGADPFEDLEIDKIVDVFIDLLNKIHDVGAEELDSRASPFDEQMALACLAKLDAVVATNRGHLALNKLTWADFLLAGMWEHVRQALDLTSEQFANMELLVQQLTAVPAVRTALEQTQDSA